MIPSFPDTRLSFPHDHPAFAGHFPGHPVVPGVLLLSAAIDSIQAATGRKVTQVTAAKFLNPVGPGVELCLSVRAGPGQRLLFDIAAQELKIASGSLSLAPEDGR
ncbi:hypothetical protein [Paludibacterium yongneupense]|uniref:hypothetical protein n=1 Tax=Paludibacterium yongneupense TaxID=400061 RepID=UPI000412CAF4|nr:hypothetical protein [Paludibacterium yongneupense]